MVPTRAKHHIYILNNLYSGNIFLHFCKTITVLYIITMFLEKLIFQNWLLPYLKTHKTASANTVFPLQVKPVAQSYLGRNQLKKFLGKGPR